MANNPHLSTASANASANAIVGLLTGTGLNGQFCIYSGTQPTNSQTALSGNTLLATLVMSATAFGAASAGVCTANAITNASAAATGTASFFRVYDKSADIGSTGIFDGSVGTSGCDLNLNTTSIVTSATVSISSFTLTQNEQTMPLYGADNQGGIALTASATMTVLELTSGTGVPAKVTELGVSFDGGSLTAGVLVQMGTRTSTSPTTSALSTVALQYGMGTAGGSVTKYTAEGTSPTYTAWKSWYVTNPGLLLVQFPLGREVYQASASKLAVWVITPASVSPHVAAHIEWEE